MLLSDKYGALRRAPLWSSVGSIVDIVNAMVNYDFLCNIKSQEDAQYFLTKHIECTTELVGCLTVMLHTRLKMARATVVTYMIITPRHSISWPINMLYMFKQM